MTKDLEETLEGLGPECRAVVGRLLASRRPIVSRTRFLRFPRAALAAACAAAILSFGLWMRFASAPAGGERAYTIYTVAYSKDRLPALVDSQNPDGSWENDFVTRQNAAALAGAQGRAENIAYRKAMRYMRLKGLRPLSREEFLGRVKRFGS